VNVRAAARRWLIDAVDAVSIYLPVVLMGILAALTYWLVRSTPLLEPAGPKPASRQTPDYIVYDFALQAFAPDGALQRVITGTEARHFPARAQFEVDGVRLVALNPQRVVTQASARTALSNSDGTEVQLMGDAVVRRPAGQGETRDSPLIEYRGEFLHVFTDTERVKSHLPVTLRRDNDVFTANEMTYDNLQRVGELSGRVRAVIQPRSATQPKPAPATGAKP
jgi:lipopolysaccharide export system protein LptC